MKSEFPFHADFNYVQGLDNETETLANVGGFTSICLAANLQSEARVDQ